MKYRWDDYASEHATLTESWIDDDARRFTGFDPGDTWTAYHDCLVHDEGMIPGENYWCKVISDAGVPFAVIAFSLYDGEYTVMEYIVDPQKRGLGLGSSALRELLENGDIIIGRQIGKVMAVIFPNNVTSQKAFEKAGFTFDHAHPDGDAWYYKYKKNPVQ